MASERSPSPPSPSATMPTPNCSKKSPGSARVAIYLTDDPANIPQIFAKETVTASKSAIDEQPFMPQVVRTTQALADLDLETAPFLLGYVMTRPKPTSEVILATEKGDPLLVWWRYGLGMTVAFTSDAKARWAAEWLTWPGYSKFWAQVVRHAMRKSDAKGVAVEIAPARRQGDRHARRDRRHRPIPEPGRNRNDAHRSATGQNRSCLCSNRAWPIRSRVRHSLSGAYHVRTHAKARWPGPLPSSPAA